MLSNETYVNILGKSKKEALYCMRELYTHLAAYGKGIHIELYFESSQGNNWCTLLFTAHTKPRNFKKIEYLVSKAPQIAGWKFEAFWPPVPIDYEMEERFSDLNIDYANCWFIPPVDKQDGSKIWLDIYIELYGQVTLEQEAAMRTAMLNVLGEKTYGLRIGGVYIQDLLGLTDKRKDRLVNLQQLAEYIKVKEPPVFFINAAGVMVEAK